jgi:hypothetical protein
MSTNKQFETHAVRRKLTNNLLGQLTGLNLFQGQCHNRIIFRSVFTPQKKLELLHFILNLILQQL